ncbi:hypothetical protein H7K24_03420 [Mycobacterium fragae]|jgi:hypothetical protein|uniref:Uncharacterized protein n=1 Tax=Mycobacterium fragae TaxID=1260918 RepID=A0A1X1V4K5_9MYCO|nr:hypothetical protein [Mycobacterium fragae]MCV7399203.1 hypothetical protein [Mycobacterium fragae]ORV63858.1 hypothetical protein AWC06_07630 [Mycobacterium fragae]
MSVHENIQAPGRRRPHERSVVLQLAQRAAIAGVGALAIIGTVGSADLLGQARADSPPCVAGPTQPCPAPVPDAANAPSQQSGPQLVCTSAGMFGQHCYRR